MTIDITIPIKTIGNNGREHWRKKAKRIAHEKRAVMTAIAGYDASTVKLPAVVRLTRCSFGELDDDNLRGALKATRDVVAAWLGIDDGDVTQVMYMYAQGFAPRLTYGVRIEVFGGYRMREHLEAV